MVLDLSEKVYRKNLINYDTLSYSSDLFSLKDLFFTSLPMLESNFSFQECLGSGWNFTEDIEFSAFRSLCDILDKFNVDDSGFNSNDFDFTNLGLLKYIYSGVMSKKFSCSDFEPEFRDFHNKFNSYKFKNSFCLSIKPKNKNGSVELVQNLYLKNFLVSSNNLGMSLVYEKASKVDDFISSLK
jgi:hypothetical protein